MSGFPAIFQLSSLNGTNGFRLDGSVVGDQAGRAVSSAGDVNGDGFDDLIVGARYADNVYGGPDSGSSYVVFGKAGGFAATINLSALNGNSGFKLTGAAAGDWSGYDVSSAGDINGDGFDDVIVGAHRADTNGINSGASYVVFGKAGGFAASLSLSSLNGINGFRFSGVADVDWSGFSVSSAGDVNGDGFDDIVIGAPYSGSWGASYVVFGKASGFVANFNLSSLDGSNGFRLDGEALDDQSGRSVSSAGDINGDGFDDLIIGAFAAYINGDGSGASYIVFGKASGFAANLNLTSLDGTNGFQISGVALGDQSGISVSSAGDVNGDGLDDLLIGADFADPNGTNSGAAYVVFGKAGGFAANLELSSLNGTNGFRLDGVAAYDRTGKSVSTAGDFNGDGFADLIIAAPYADPNGSNSGTSYVVFGKASGFAASINLSSLNGSNGFRIDGVAALDYSGWSVSGAGDVNGDGFDDLIVGASNADPNGEASGASYVIFGQRAQTAVTITGTALGLTHNGGLGKDTIKGLGGNDTLKGWESNDTLVGGAGDDVIVGGSGRDVMTGGGNKDVFFFGSITDSGTAGSARDVITDFRGKAGTGFAFIDRIDVSAIDATAGTNGDQAFTYVGAAGFSGEGQIRAIQDGAHTKLLFNTTGNGNAEMVVVLHNYTATNLTAADFIL